MRYFFEFWYMTFRLAVFILLSRKKETKRAAALVGHLEETLNGKFNAATREKIVKSYSIYNPMICDAFTRLQGRFTRETEKTRLIYYFICSSLFDDFTDHSLLTGQQLSDISFSPQSYRAGTFDEQAFLHAHLYLLDNVKDQEGYDKVSHELFRAQADSKQQYESTLTDEEIRSVTFRKGGNSVLLCHYYLEEDLPEAAGCWYKIGTLIQLTNDLYDIHKDISDRIDTLPNRMKDAYAFEQFFTAQIAEMKQLIHRLPCREKQKKMFSLSMAGIYAFGLIAIEQLKKIQGGKVALPPLGSLPRKALIIDMENPSNMIKWLRFTYRYAKLSTHREDFHIQAAYS